MIVVERSLLPQGNFSKFLRFEGPAVSIRRFPVAEKACEAQTKPKIDN
jgi:hypothetical protein